MSDSRPQTDIFALSYWQEQIQLANQHNIFCKCRSCGKEWVDSSANAACSCGSKQVERISCWQFPDD